MKFEYKARNPKGEIQVGFVEAQDKDSAVNILSSHGLFILAINEPSQSAIIKSAFFRFANRVSDKDLMIMTRQFATLLSAGVPLTGALRTLRSQTQNAILGETIDNIGKEIDSGLSLSQSLSNHGDVFSEFYINMVRSAEITGRVDEVMEFLADYIEKQAALSSKVKNALIYPIFMVVLLFLVVILMSTLVFPQIEQVFKEIGGNLPTMTLAIINFGKFMTHWWWAVIISFIALWAITSDYLKTREGKILMDSVALHLPIFSGLLRKLYIARFADSISVLTKGGVSIVQSLEISARTIGSVAYQEVLEAAANDVRNGVLLSQSLAKYPKFFPPLVSQMIAIGESTSSIDALLKKISNFYSREIDDLVGNLVELIQPIMMLVIGGVIGVLFASILLPIYKFIDTSFK